MTDPSRSRPDTAGPYIVWENYGYEGWQPKSYPTLREAVTAHSYQSERVVTKISDFQVVESDGANSL